MNLELLRCHSPSIRSMCAPKSRMAHDSLINIYIYKHANVYVHANMYIYIYIYIDVQPIARGMTFSKVL